MSGILDDVSVVMLSYPFSSGNIIYHPVVGLYCVYFSVLGTKDGTWYVSLNEL